MTAGPIEIWANGTIKPDATVESVTASLQRLFPTATPEQRARFFAGKSFRVTTTADQAAADRAISALQSAGVIVIQRQALPPVQTPDPAATQHSPKSVPSPAPSQAMRSVEAVSIPQSDAQQTPTTRARPSTVSPPAQPARVNTVSTAQHNEGYLPYEPADEAPRQSLLSRLVQLALAGGATWKQALGVTVVGYFMMTSLGQHSAILRILGVLLFMWGAFMFIRRRPPIPDGFQSELDRIAKEMGDSQLLFSTKKEMHHLPQILSASERLLAFSSGYMSGNTWLIALTDSRIIFLDKGLLYGLKQVTIDLDKVNSVSGSTGALFGQIDIEDNASQRRIKNVPRGSVIKFTNKVRDAIEVRKNILTGGAHRPNDVSSQLSQLASLHEKGLLTSDEFNQQKAKLLAGA